MSCTGTPSVITIASGMPASTASITAALVKAGGTNSTDTSAPVFSIASATVPNTGMSWPSMVTVSPALRGFTPPTMLVPEASIRVVCFMPSEPVMPWTTTMLCSVRKMAMSAPQALCRSLASSAALSAAPSMVSTTVTSGWLRSARMRRPSSTLLPSRRTTSGLVASSPSLSSAPHDAARDRVASGDAAEDVHEHRLHLLVAEDDVEAVGHHLGRCASADVEEVGGLDPAVLLAGVRDDVEGRHHQAGTVADDPDRAVELDVVEVLLLGLELERVDVLDELERRVVLVAELRVARRGRPCRRGPRASRHRAGPAG